MSGNLPLSYREKLRREVFPYLAPSLRLLLERLEPGRAERLEEIRVRSHCPLVLRDDRGEYFLTEKGGATASPGAAYIVSGEEVWKTVQLISQGSFYAFEEEFRQGFLTIPGGHRVGLAGRAVLENGGVKTLRDIGSLNFRMARAVPGAADPILPFVLSDRGERFSPPRAGKTTVLRDLVRQLSTGVRRLGFQGINVGVVDERSEIAACYAGVPQHDLGPRVDVLDRCPKAAGMMLLVRAMSPQVIATDEIGKAEDAEALEDVRNAGVGVVATVHAGSLEELERRPKMREVLGLGVFERFVLLSRRQGPGTVEGIWDEGGRRLGP